ncbi:MAG: hypothetical protein HYZ11_12545 [Candidatus Tectomicrobia bacterium]|uniref:Lipoprotein n=1 Tax=Tectimicrobiota bacterium TaxID=2528274 RepID=A0A932MPA5_UNCTE|nr:hypothetical protein [Candidatus Tectomicrobia bacterium]
MRKCLGIAGLLVLALIAAGCVSTTWNKPGAMHAQSVKDVNECAGKAGLPVIEGNNPVAGHVMPYSYEQEKVYTKCMTDKGYKAKM